LTGYYVTARKITKKQENYCCGTEDKLYQTITLLCGEFTLHSTAEEKLHCTFQSKQDYVLWNAVSHRCKKNVFYVFYFKIKKRVF